jgi:hypothetical protein
MCGSSQTAARRRRQVAHEAYRAERQGCGDGEGGAEMAMRIMGLEDVGPRPLCRERLKTLARMNGRFPSVHIEFRREGASRLLKKSGEKALVFGSI